jgi:uncharacterized GH25 family protein
MQMKRALITAVFVLSSVGLLFAHDMFLKLGTFFLDPGSEATVTLLNGTFERSENVITRDRMIDVSIVGPDTEVSHPEASQWRDEDNAANLDFTTGVAGTYTIGVSTAPNMIELTADEFNDYLLHDGVLDILQLRKDRDDLDEPARERYAKHVKAIVQVGDERTAGYDARLGHPVELVPLQNPYDLRPSDTLQVLFLKDGAPMAGQIVYASYAGFEPRAYQRNQREAVETTTDLNGVARIRIDEPGIWYVRLIHMVPVDEPDVDYVSNWATLTFEIR